MTTVRCTTCGRLPRWPIRRTYSLRLRPTFLPSRLSSRRAKWEQTSLSGVPSDLASRWDTVGRMRHSSRRGRRSCGRLLDESLGSQSTHMETWRIAWRCKLGSSTFGVKRPLQTSVPHRRFSPILRRCTASITDLTDWRQSPAGLTRWLQPLRKQQGAWATRNRIRCISIRFGFSFPTHPAQPLCP